MQTILELLTILGIIVFRRVICRDYRNWLTTCRMDLP